ncbi:MAG TPA: hypothetical protein PLS93_10845, partial [Accumulibacter sp.]|nr:hypothetical protein [Accumulibacter sp.]
ACLRVERVSLSARVVRASARADCGQPQCVQATASVTVTDAVGNPVPRARVQLRFMNVSAS